MLSECDTLQSDNDDSQSESWSYPSSYLQFSAAGKPKSRLGRRKLQSKSNLTDEVKGVSGGSEVISRGRTWQQHQTPLKSSLVASQHGVTPAKDPLKDILNIKRDQSPTSHPHLSTTLYESIVFTTPGHHHQKGFGPIPSPLDPLHGIIGQDDSFVTAVASPPPKPGLPPPGPRCALEGRFQETDDKNAAKGKEELHKTEERADTQELSPKKEESIPTRDEVDCKTKEVFFKKVKDSNRVMTFAEVLSPCKLSDKFNTALTSDETLAQSPTIVADKYQTQTMDLFAPIPLSKVSRELKENSPPNPIKKEEDNSPPLGPSSKKSPVMQAFADSAAPPHKTQGPCDIFRSKTLFDRHIPPESVLSDRISPQGAQRESEKRPPSHTTAGNPGNRSSTFEPPLRAVGDQKLNGTYPTSESQPKTLEHRHRREPLSSIGGTHQRSGLENGPSGGAQHQYPKTPKPMLHPSEKPSLNPAESKFNHHYSGNPSQPKFEAAGMFHQKEKNTLSDHKSHYPPLSLGQTKGSEQQGVTTQFRDSSSAQSKTTMEPLPVKSAQEKNTAQNPPENKFDHYYAVPLEQQQPRDPFPGPVLTVQGGSAENEGAKKYQQPTSVSQTKEHYSSVQSRDSQSGLVVSQQRSHTEKNVLLNGTTNNQYPASLSQIKRSESQSTIYSQSGPVLTQQRSVIEKNTVLNGNENYYCVQGKSSSVQHSQSGAVLTQQRISVETAKSTVKEHYYPKTLEQPSRGGLPPKERPYLNSQQPHNPNEYYHNPSSMSQQQQQNSLPNSGYCPTPSSTSQQQSSLPNSAYCAPTSEPSTPVEETKTIVYREERKPESAPVPQGYQPPLPSHGREPEHYQPNKRIEAEPPVYVEAKKEDFKRPWPVVKQQQPQVNTLYVNKKPYTALSLLGRGGSSEVYQVLEPKTSHLMAIKCVNLSSVDENIATGYINEIKLLSQLQECTSVIKMFDHEYLEDTKMLYVVMEKGDTDFSKLMKDITKTKKISMTMISYYWTEMLNAVKDIHDKGIIHSDLKPANFLLVAGRLKLIDFGIASKLNGDMTSVMKEVTTGTFNYMSPEAIGLSGDSRGHKITYRSDVWSLGCILYNMIFGRTPFSHIANTWAKLQAIANSETKVELPRNGRGIPEELRLSLEWCLRKDPKARPTVQQLLQLPYDTAPTSDPPDPIIAQINALKNKYSVKMFPGCCDPAFN